MNRKTAEIAKAWNCGLDEAKRGSAVNAEVFVEKDFLTIVDVRELPSGTLVAFKIQGLWSCFQVERKVDELIYGLRKIGKDWRPKVKGMQPAGGGGPSSP